MREDMVERFWQKVKRAGPEDCWNWTGTTQRNRTGMRYGYFRLDGKMRRAPRVSFQIAFGVDPSHVPGGVVMHKCDNPLCVNPRHLVLGTQADNVKDRDSKKRGVTPYGVNHGRAKLSDADVSEIRRLRTEGVTIRTIAEMFGVSHFAVTYATKHGWKHI